MRLLLLIPSLLLAVPAVPAVSHAEPSFMGFATASGATVERLNDACAHRYGAGARMCTSDELEETADIRLGFGLTSDSLESARSSHAVSCDLLKSIACCAPARAEPPA